MAEIVLYMNAQSVIAEEKCAGCDKCFGRGERMAAAEDSDGEPMGWFCDDCINDWRANGVESRIFKDKDNG